MRRYAGITVATVLVTLAANVGLAANDGNAVGAQPCQGCGATQANCGQQGCAAESGCCPAADCCECEPLWTVRAGTIILQRSHASAQPSLTVHSIRKDPVVFDAQDLNPGWAAGFDLTLIRRLSSCWDAEVRYFQIDGFHDSKTINAPPNDLINFQGFGVTSGESSTFFMDYTSRVYSTEANLRWWPREWLPLLIGFRTLQLHEHFTILRDPPEPTLNALEDRTNNYLYGFQIGAEPILYDNCGRFRVEGMLKAGAYGNTARVEGIFQHLGTDVQDVRNVTSFVGEVGVTAVYRVTDHLAARCGYELLWLTSVALAPDQSSTVDAIAATGRVNTDDTAFFHGVTVGLEYVF